MGIFNFTENLISSRTSTGCFKLQQRVGEEYPNCREADFVKAMILYSQAFTYWDLIHVAKSKFGKDLKKKCTNITDANVKLLITLEAIQLFWRFKNMKGFYESFKMKPKKIQEMLIGINDQGGDYIKRMFLELKSEDSLKIHIYELFKILMSDKPNNLPLLISLMSFKVSMLENYLNEYMSKIIGEFSSMNPSEEI